MLHTLSVLDLLAVILGIRNKHASRIMDVTSNNSDVYNFYTRLCIRCQPGCQSECTDVDPPGPTL
jgi:hypothetical protein